MAFIKKNFAVFIAITATVLTACGSGKTGSSTSDASNNSQSAIKEAEGQSKETSSEANGGSANIDNSGNGSESSGSGNYQDYWKGDDYFDIVAYLKANGAKDAFGTDGGAPIPTTKNIAMYIGNFYDDRWEIMVFSGGLTLAHVYYESDGLQKKNPHYMLSCPADQLGKSVRVDNYGTSINYGTLEMLDTVVQYMNKNPYSDDPLNGSGLRYTNNPL